jgi:hypothetical protein
MFIVELFKVGKQGIKHTNITPVLYIPISRRRVNIVIRHLKEIYREQGLVL